MTLRFNECAILFLMSAIDLLRDLISRLGPPGQEGEVAEYLIEAVTKLGLSATIDPKGNIGVPLGPDPKVVVTAHMDEIAMLVTQVLSDGSLKVAPLGGLYPWKLGEGLVTILNDGRWNGVLSFGSIHTEVPNVAKESGPSWSETRVLTGRTASELQDAGIGPGTRVVSAQRKVHQVGNLIASRFLDDRADLVSWLLALEQLKGRDLPVLFAATTSEEVGGEGAQYLMHRLQPDVCIALELGPNVPDAPVEINSVPSLWVSDSYSAMSPADIELVRSCGPVQLQALSRGGSDASCAASRGLCARPITLGLPMENSHGFEVMHPEAMTALAHLTCNLINKLI